MCVLPSNPLGLPPTPLIDQSKYQAPLSVYFWNPRMFLYHMGKYWKGDEVEKIAFIKCAVDKNWVQSQASGGAVALQSVQPAQLSVDAMLPFFNHSKEEGSELQVITVPYFTMHR